MLPWAGGVNFGSIERNGSPALASNEIYVGVLLQMVKVQINTIPITVVISRETIT